MYKLITLITISFILLTGCITDPNNNSNVIRFNPDFKPGHYTSINGDENILGLFWAINIHEDDTYFSQIFWGLNQCELKGTDSTGFIRCQYENDGIVSDWEPIEPFFKSKTSFKNVTKDSFEYYNSEYFIKIFYGMDNNNKNTLQKRSEKVEWIKFIKE